MTLFKEGNSLFPFQADHVVLAYAKNTTLLVWDTGTGKSIGALALACLCLEDNLVDHVVLCCETNKLVSSEWPAQIEEFTSIDWKLYHGTPAKRKKIRENLPQLLLTTFDTVRNDAAIFPPKRGRSRGIPQPGPLLDVLDGKRVLVIYDETTRIANRGSDNYKAHKLFLDTLREGPGLKVLAMTATPMERDPVSMYDLGRLLYPSTMCIVSEFEHQYVSRWDIFRKPIGFKNLIPEGCDPDVVPFAKRFEPILLRKRKSDPDVVNFFPKRREMPPTFVDLSKQHKLFYDRVAQIANEVPEFEQRKYVTVLRQIAGHPLSLLTAEGEIAKAIVDVVSPAGLQAMGSAKTDRMVSWCREVVQDQGAQAVIFTFYAHSILPLLQTTLEGAGFSVSVNHGGLSLASRSVAQNAFRAGETQIFLTSDAGSKGLNLPEATYLLHYEHPGTHSLLVQRSDRIHRIDSLSESVFIYSLIARGTIEEGLANLSLRRNDWSDKVLGDDETTDLDFLTAADRKSLLKIGKRK